MCLLNITSREGEKNNGDKNFLAYKKTVDKITNEKQKEKYAGRGKAYKLAKSSVAQT